MPSDLHHAFRSSPRLPIFTTPSDLHHESRSSPWFSISIPASGTHRMPHLHHLCRSPNTCPALGEFSLIDRSFQHPRPSGVQWIRSPLDGSFTRDSSFIQDISFIRHSSFIQDGSFTRYASFIRHKFSAFHIETIALRSENHSMIRRNPISIHKISAPYFTESRPFLPHRPLPHRND